MDRPTCAWTVLKILGIEKYPELLRNCPEDFEPVSVPFVCEAELSKSSTHRWKGKCPQQDRANSDCSTTRMIWCKWWVCTWKSFNNCSVFLFENENDWQDLKSDTCWVWHCFSVMLLNQRLELQFYEGRQTKHFINWKCLSNTFRKMEIADLAMPGREAVQSSIKQRIKTHQVRLWSMSSSMRPCVTHVAA